MNSPKQIAESYIETGVAKAEMPKLRMFLLAIFAGAFIAFAGVAATVGTALLGKIAGACIFPAGLAMVVVAGSELFTGNNLMIISALEKRITVKQLLLAWLVVWLGNLVGSLFVAAFSVWGGAFDTVTYAPVSAARRAARGYDQAYLLARETARHWEVEPLTLLRKTRDNPPQSGLDAAARRGNVVGVYEPCNREKMEGRHVLLIDDILTTGSTLSECARVLRGAGAASVVCACLAAATVESHRAR